MRCPKTAHALSYAYKLGCRCEACVTTHRDRCYQTRINARNKAAAVQDGSCLFPHLKPYTSYQYGCRCERCKAGQAKSTRRYRWRKKRNRVKQRNHPKAA